MIHALQNMNHTFPRGACEGNGRGFAVFFMFRIVYTRYTTESGFKNEEIV